MWRTRGRVVVGGIMDSTSIDGSDSDGSLEPSRPCLGSKVLVEGRLALQQSLI